MGIELYVDWIGFGLGWGAEMGGGGVVVVGAVGLVEG